MEDQTPFTPPENGGMDMKTRIVYWLLMQGLGVVVMAVGLWILYQERREAHLQAQACNDRLIELVERQLVITTELKEYLNPDKLEQKTSSNHVKKTR